MSLRYPFVLLLCLSGFACVELPDTPFVGSDGGPLDSGGSDGLDGSPSDSGGSDGLDGSPSDSGASDALDAGVDAAAFLPTFVPLYGLDFGWASEATRQIAPATAIVVDTDLGTVDGVAYMADFRVVGPYDCFGSSQEIGVFVVQTVDVPLDVTVRVRGTRGAAFLVAGDVSIHGRIDVGGGIAACPEGFSWCAGPGGWEGGATGNPPEPGFGPGGGGAGDATGGPGDETGGGGGGHGALGGAGGDETDGPRRGGLGGATYDGTLPLCGGSGGGGGGRGSGTGVFGQHGGGGGGALYIASATRIEVSGARSGINAGGGGGSGDHISLFDDGGGGGGAGGSIVLEAPTVVIGADAIVAANGGGGGGGNRGGIEYEDGEAAGLTTVRTRAGVGGGRGGALSHPAGEMAPGFDDGTGGGGGGVGRILIRAVETSSLTLDGASSPAAGTGIIDPVP